MTADSGFWKHWQGNFRAGFAIVLPLGFLIVVPKSKIRRLKLPVADAMKYVISLGSIAPDLRPASRNLRAVPPPSDLTIA